MKNDKNWLKDIVSGFLNGYCLTGFKNIVNNHEYLRKQKNVMILKLILFVIVSFAKPLDKKKRKTHANQ